MISEKKADLLELIDIRAFDQFTTDLTIGNGSTFVLVGSTTAITDLAIGTLSLLVASSGSTSISSVLLICPFQHANRSS